MSSLLWKVLLGAGGGAAAAFDPSSVSGYSRDWNFADATKIYSDRAHTTLVTADGDPLGSILCSAGSGVYLVADSDAKRPTHKTSIQNGLSVGRWDGLDDAMTGAITAGAVQTVIMAVKKRAVAIASTQSLASWNANNSAYTHSSNSLTALQYYLGNGGGFDTGGNVTNWSIIVLRKASTASMKVYHNGGSATEFNPNDGYDANTSIGFGSAGDWDIGRIMHFTTAPSNSDLDYLIGGLGTLYNISVTAVV